MPSGWDDILAVFPDPVITNSEWGNSRGKMRKGRKSPQDLHAYMKGQTHIKGSKP
jgi:hypothetical protein